MGPVYPKDDHILIVEYIWIWCYSRTNPCLFSRCAAPQITQAQTLSIWTCQADNHGHIKVPLYGFSICPWQHDLRATWRMTWFFLLAKQCHKPPEIIWHHMVFFAPMSSAKSLGMVDNDLLYYALLTN